MRCCFEYKWAGVQQPPSLGYLYTIFSILWLGNGTKVRVNAPFGSLVALFLDKRDKNVLGGVSRSFRG